MFNRPKIKQIDKIDFLQPQKQILSNGIPLYIINACQEDVSRIDFIFEAGVWQQKKPLVAHFTNQMLKEGCENFSSAQIAEKLDFYGAWLQLSNGYHQSFVTLYSLNKYLPQTLALLEQMIKKSTFPENEFKTILHNRKQNYLVESEKVNVLANRRFQQCLYGANHPYGKLATLSDYETLEIDSLKEFYRANYGSKKCTIVFSGNIEKEMIEQVHTVFGKDEWGSSSAVLPEPTYTISADTQKKHFVLKEDSVQSAVIIGRPLVNFTHPDFHYLQILNTIFGGYFGSRLMSNIREKKGYTYGISSYISPLLRAGHLTISSQTATKYVQLLIDEVYKEMEKLCNKPISASELSRVKSYMMGETIRSFDGVFAQADSLISLLTSGLDYCFYEESIESIKTISPQVLQRLAQSYFSKADFYQVVSGSDK